MAALGRDECISLVFSLIAANYGSSAVALTASVSLLALPLQSTIRAVPSSLPLPFCTVIFSVRCLALLYVEQVVGYSLCAGKHCRNGSLQQDHCYLKQDTSFVNVGRQFFTLPQTVHNHSTHIRSSLRRRRLIDTGEGVSTPAGMTNVLLPCSRRYLWANDQRLVRRTTRVYSPLVWMFSMARTPRTAEYRQHLCRRCFSTSLESNGALLTAHRLLQRRLYLDPPLMTGDCPTSYRDDVGATFGFWTTTNRTSTASRDYNSRTVYAHFAAQQKLLQEVSDLSDFINTLPYLDAVSKEGLRVHPAAASTDRVALADDIIPLAKPLTTVLTSIPVKAGQVFHIPIGAQNLDPSVWGSDAAEFRPERWFEPGGVPSSPMAPTLVYRPSWTDSVRVSVGVLVVVREEER
ncbi:hypothetical protein BDZ89DRAFT_1143089 [Hymenopellis radicata]|nr:hypothetical protein BDZ89DRAFT_1143089 [Hymenopellis radicata]